MNRRRLLILLIFVISLALIGLVAYSLFHRPSSTPNLELTGIDSIHAVRIDYMDMNSSQAVADDLEKQMKPTMINMVSLGAGRVDWTYFPWKGHPDRWSGEVKHSGVDYLARDSARFGEWAHVSAVVDMLSPRYIQSHPGEAAVSYTGIPSANLVSTMDLVEGNFGQDALDMIEFIAINYPVNSITISELVYYVDGFGEDDKAAYLAYSGQPDWPRTADGVIDIDSPFLGSWRVYEINRFLERAATIVHQYNKLLFFEVKVSLDENGNVIAKNGTDLNAFLKYVDKLVVWGNYDPRNQPADVLGPIASNLAQLGSEKVIMMIGLWDDLYNPDFPKEQMAAVPAEVLRIMIQSADQAGMDNQWISPSFLISQAHWDVMQDLWGHGSTSP